MVILHKFESNSRFRKGPLVVSFGKEAAWIKIFHRLDNLHIRYLRSDDLHDSSAGSGNLNFQALRTKPTPLMPRLRPCSFPSCSHHRGRQDCWHAEETRTFPRLSTILPAH